MKLHEYQAKEVLRKAGVSVPAGELVTNAGDAAAVAGRLKGPPWVVKAQVHAGGRGKAGGVRVIDRAEEVPKAVEDMIGKKLVTRQTGPRGVTIHQVLVEEGIAIDRELYLGMLVDRSCAAPTLIFSRAGGMEIEEVAAKSPELILKGSVDPAAGWMPYLARNLAYGLEPLPSPDTLRALMGTMANLYRVFMKHDCSLVEINPLVISAEGSVVALDAKMTIDDNALFRQKDLRQYDDPREKDPLEVMAEESNLNYIRLDDNVGAMVNGAGLAMATMDVIKLAGAEPANFLDVGGGANEEMIAKGIEIILQDERVKAILINIFGGIMRCDVLARGVVAAARKKGIRLPLIVRLEGTNVEEGRSILEESDLEFLVAKDLGEAAELVAKQVS